MNKNLLKELKSFLKIDQIITDKSSIQVYQRDGLSGYSGTPGMVLLPESENDIVKIVKICSKYNIPVVTRGAGTGLSGGAVPTNGSIVLSTSRLNKILNNLKKFGILRNFINVSQFFRKNQRVLTFLSMFVKFRQNFIKILKKNCALNEKNAKF